MKGLHKIDDSLEHVPLGLEYKEEYWDSALTMIEAHEAKVAWLKILGGVSAAAVIVFASVFWSIKTEASELAFDHSAEQLALTSKTEMARVNPFESGNENATNPSTSTPVSNVVAGNTSSVNFESGSEYIDQDETASDALAISETAQQNDGLGSALTSADETRGSADKTGIADAGLASTQGNAEETVDNEYGVSEVAGGDSSLTEESPLADHDENSQESAGPNNDQNFAPTDEGITLSTDGPKSIIPISAETLNIATQTTLSSEMNALANSSVSEWIPVDQSELISMNGVESELFENELDYSPLLLDEPLAENPFTLRKKLNVQLIAGYNFATDYNANYWDLYTPDLDQKFVEEVGDQSASNSRYEANAMLGLGIDYNFNTRWSMNSNVHYFSASKLNFGQNIQDCWIGLSGRECASRYMQTSKLHMFSVPVNIAMRLGRKAQISGGFGADFTVQNDYVIERFYHNGEEIDLARAASLGDAVVREVTAEKGYLDAFRTVNYFANAGINYYLTESVTIGATYQYGLSDITRNQLVAQTFDRNSRMYGYVRFRVW